jgi:hypothetical protein
MKTATKRTYPPDIFSGDASIDLWDEINSARTKKQLRRALYTVCCRIQELETRIEKLWNSTQPPVKKKIRARKTVKP